MADENQAEGAVAPEVKETKPNTVEAKQVKADELPPEALKARLDSSRQAGAKEAEAALAKELGMSPKEAREALARLREIEESSKTEQQRLLEERDTYKSKAERVDALSQRVVSLSEAEYSLLSDENKAFVDELSSSNGEVNHERRLEVITSLKRRTGLMKPAATLPAGSSTSAAPPAPKTTAEPEPGSPEAHYRTWASYKGPLKAAYWHDHQASITKAPQYTSGG